ncbi:MAG: hypothetical protein JOY70_01915 [Acidisphaera sp.]|nr:hypothetical protein [Acidisphaera sp.]
MSDALAIAPYTADAVSKAIAAGVPLRAQLTQLTEQASTGYVSQTFAGLGASASVSLSVNAALGQNQAIQAAINAATGSMGVAQSALSQISTIASNFYSQTVNLNGLDPATVDSIASDARSALQEVATLLDSKDGDTYVFAGQDSGNPPVPNPDAIGSSGFATQIAAAVGSLGGNGAPATIAATLAAASSNAPGVSPFSAALSQPAASLQALRTSVPTGAGASVPTGILASANGDVTSTGSSTTGSYMRDVLRALATIGSLSSTQVGNSGFAQLVADTRTSLGGAISALNQDAGVMGDRQTSLTDLNTALAQTATAMTAQLSNVQDVDMASTLSKLSTVQTQLQASYEAVSVLQNLTLVHFLTTA